MEPPNQQDVELIVSYHVAKLMEHCDSVQILASIHDPDSKLTKNFFQGAGNWFARRGMAAEFLKLENAVIERMRSPA